MLVEVIRWPPNLHETTRKVDLSLLTRMQKISGLYSLDCKKSYEIPCLVTARGGAFCANQKVSLWGTSNFEHLSGGDGGGRGKCCFD